MAQLVKKLGSIYAKARLVPHNRQFIFKKLHYFDGKAIEDIIDVSEWKKLDSDLYIPDPVSYDLVKRGIFLCNYDSPFEAAYKTMDDIVSEGNQIAIKNRFNFFEILISKDSYINEKIEGQIISKVNLYKL